jgi:hypothetical protein
MLNIVRLLRQSEDLSFRWTRKKDWMIVSSHAVKTLVSHNRRAVGDIYEGKSENEIPYFIAAK